MKKEWLEFLQEEKRSFKEKFNSVSKPRLLISGGLITSGAVVEALGGDKSSIYMQAGGAAMILAGACIVYPGKHEVNTPEQEKTSPGAQDWRKTQ
jgi:hypothetical protein